MKRSPLPRISARKRAKARQRAEVVRQVRERDQHCQMFERWYHQGTGSWYGSLDPMCAGPLDVHEIIPRSAWRDGDLDPDNCVLVCRRHHDWIGNHPLQAAELGLHGFSWQRKDSA